MIAADLVGFHSFDDARHFLIAAKRILGLSAHTRAGGILSLVLPDREVVVSMNHVSIEPDVVAAAVDHPETRRQMEIIRSK
jgi:trehalose 6-phosphate synthase/phosphatase